MVECCLKKLKSVIYYEWNSVLAQIQNLFVFKVFANDKTYAKCDIDFLNRLCKAQNNVTRYNFLRYTREFVLISVTDLRVEATHA